MLNDFLNLKNKSQIRSKKNQILNWDLWKYTQTDRDIEDLFYYLEIQAEFSDLEMFTKMNQLSNKIFKNLDMNFEIFKKNIMNLSESIYNEDENAEMYFDEFNSLEKDILKSVLHKLLDFYKRNKFFSDEIHNRFLRLLIDEDVKKTENSELSSDNSVSIRPLADTIDIYNEKNIFRLSEKEIKTEKQKEPTIDNQSQKKENKPTNDDEILKIAIEIVKELGNSFNSEDLINEKSKISEIVKDVLSERKKINEEAGIRRIIDQAIEEVLHEKDFEDL